MVGAGVEVAVVAGLVVGAGVRVGLCLWVELWVGLWTGSNANVVDVAGASSGCVSVATSGCGWNRARNSSASAIRRRFRRV